MLIYIYIYIWVRIYCSRVVYYVPPVCASRTLGMLISAFTLTPILQTYSSLPVVAQYPYTKRSVSHRACTIAYAYRWHLRGVCISPHDTAVVHDILTISIPMYVRCNEWCAHEYDWACTCVCRGQCVWAITHMELRHQRTVSDHEMVDRESNVDQIRCPSIIDAPDTLSHHPIVLHSHRCTIDASVCVVIGRWAPREGMHHRRQTLGPWNMIRRRCLKWRWKEEVREQSNTYVIVMDGSLYFCRLLTACGSWWNM